MDIHDIEKTSLEAHVSLCQERYTQLARRLDVVEERMGNIESMLREIRDDIQEMREHHTRKWDTTQIGIIGMLVAISGYLLVRALFQ